ncbi:hypothetical protein NMG29_06550 [Streptomyces cocklensis]|uniref:Uncharacterized protein n=1 Tax=Actinacidiphila cocklensis TaxID=887465 RepID=A0A9W4DMA9_9ACTN|nr:hypothetical protein [Actinacidiphila cocklensis]MDD1057891.1 hypothetical protein [Actinacidiphila cocklensis]CAG6392752.1 hypothetical protein SCOCK_180129 [Actinacidiphila cocklensis]
MPYTGDPMTAAELRDRAVRRLTATPRPTTEDIAEADAWARIAISASISETGTTPPEQAH